MRFDVLTLFPKMFEGPFAESMVKRAVEKGVVEIHTHDMRQWAWNSYGAVDDRPFGGGVGMLIRVDVIAKALKDVKKEGARVVLMSARGKRYTQADAKRLSGYKNLVIVCGHYEGFDERVSSLVDEEISIGDFVLTGGEIPAMVVIDSVSRLLPGVLGKDESSTRESFSTEGYIEYPQYTRPREFNGETVPEVLLSGDPKKIEEWQNDVTREKSRK
ncbi:tRNA (guanosine(37)-N1)-methyltransferase TrmD [Candidatus Shapirobacteria bacterium]|nr:tRNA (guanosine(37)-N1)-methyltransferase TrmD [Candidatus Shapirobacteria bacterium]